MSNFAANLPHMIMGTVAIAAVTVLSLHGTISGGEALGVIGAASGFTMAAGAAFASTSMGGAGVPAASISPGQTATHTETVTLAAAPPQTTAS